MAGPARPGRRLDAFLRRRLAPAAYERVRACELCVVGGGAGGRALRHVVLSDRRLYLAEHPPRRLRRVAALRDVAAIELIDDYPEFLSPRDRETNQHIRIIYYPTALKKESERPKGKATLLQDPLYASALSSAGRGQRPYRSEEKMKYFSQLKSELFLKDNTLRKTVCLVTELKAAAQKNFILKRLFWKTSDLFHFLVDKLHEYLPESRDKNTLQNKSQRADELVACIEIVQTLGLMFRETETESSRLSTLAAKKGILFNLLVILISEPQIPKSCPVVDIQLVADSTLVEMSFDAELQKLLQEYTDTATALLFEILLVSQQVSFVASMVKQMVKGLSAPCQLLSPGQAVLLYQRFYILKSCLQYSGTLAEHIRNDYTEEFRYFIHGPALERRLPPCYPVAPLTAQLLPPRPETAPPETA